MKRTRSRQIDKSFVKEDHHKRILTEVPAPLYCEPGARAYRSGQLTVIVGRSNSGWHVSIAHPSRYPTWDEVADIRYQLLPDDVHMAMMLPPGDEYVNLHPNCFHLHQVVDARNMGGPITSVGGRFTFPLRNTR